MPRTVLLLLSDKRSGSTIVQDELCKHPDVGRVGYSPHTYFETQHWLAAAAMLRRPEALFSGGKTYATYRSPGTARTYLADLLMGNLPGFAPPADDRSLAFDGWEALCDQFARPVFFEKSPQHLAHWAALSLMLEWKAQTAFTVKILFLVRNPLAVQHSAQELFGTPAEQRQFGWLEIQRNLLALRAILPAADSLTVRYEDILADPSAAFERICIFAGLPANPAIGTGVHSHSAEKWRDDPNFTLALDPAVRQIAMELGYSAEELENERGVAREIQPGQPVALRIKHLARWLRNGIAKPLVLRLRGSRH